MPFSFSYPVRRFTSLSLTALLLTSCLATTPYEGPQISVPARWNADAITSEGTEIPTQWWSVFKDPSLNILVEKSGTANLDLQAGVARIQQARAGLKMAGASLLPTADAALSATRSYADSNAMSSNSSTALSAGLSIAYELDLFGKNQATLDKAKANLNATALTQKALEITTSADVTDAYFNLLLTRERIRISNENLKTAKELLRIVKARVDAGIDSNLELSEQKVAVANVEAAMTALAQNETSYNTALAILLGHAPQNFKINGTALNKITVPAIAVGQPSTLLERRPDIAAMEQKLMAAHANIMVARAAYYPSITLGVTPALTGTGLSDPLGIALSAAAGLTAPIFDGGRIEGGVEQATAEQQELLASYQKTVLTAFGEVENALSAVKTSNERQIALSTAVNEAKKAYTISRKRYDVGTIDFATVLRAQANVLSAEDAYAQALKSRLSASLDLVKALGGGWTS